MAVTRLKIYLNNTAADDEQLSLFTQIKVDLAIGMAGEAELQIDVGADRTGRWSWLEEEFLQPFQRLRVEVKVRDGEFTPLIDGPIVSQRFELSAKPNRSRMIVVVQDDSVLLNQDEEVELYENKTADEIAGQLFQQYGLTADTDRVTAPAAGLTRYLVRRGTAMQFLRELARRHGMFVYVDAGDAPGVSTGVFKRPDTAPGDYPGLVLTGSGHNIREFTAGFDGLAPLTARADSVDATDISTVSSETDSSDLDAQGAEAVHAVTRAGKTLLARTREETDDLDAATAAAVNHSSWAYMANTEVVADNYSAVLKPYKTIDVTGVGGHLSGTWLISQVTHHIDGGRYRQSLTLRRNARSAGTSGGGGSALSGVF